MVSRIPQNGFIRPVFRLFFAKASVMCITYSLLADSEVGRGDAGWAQNSNKNKEEAPAASRSDQLARWISARIDRAAQMNNNAPTVVVTAADSSEYRTAWAP